MRDSIAQFMWGFQSHFRSGLERVARDLFEQIGFGLGARAFLVGFTDDDQQRFPVCFEPEQDPLGVVDLSGVVARGGQLYDKSEESNYFYSSGRHHERILCRAGSVDAHELGWSILARKHDRTPQEDGMGAFVGMPRPRVKHQVAQIRQGSVESRQGVEPDKAIHPAAGAPMGFVLSMQEWPGRSKSKGVLCTWVLHVLGLQNWVMNLPRYWMDNERGAGGALLRRIRTFTPRFAISTPG